MPKNGLLGLFLNNPSLLLSNILCNGMEVEAEDAVGTYELTLMFSDCGELFTGMVGWYIFGIGGSVLIPEKAEISCIV